MAGSANLQLKDKLEAPQVGTSGPSQQRHSRRYYQNPTALHCLSTAHSDNDTTVVHWVKWKGLRQCQCKCVLLHTYKLCCTVQCSVVQKKNVLNDRHVWIISSWLRLQWIWQMSKPDFQPNWVQVNICKYCRINMNPSPALSKVESMLDWWKSQAGPGLSTSNFSARFPTTLIGKVTSRES